MRLGIAIIFHNPGLIMTTRSLITGIMSTKNMREIIEKGAMIDTMTTEIGAIKNWS
jgi:hypothetical protein